MTTDTTAMRFVTRSGSIDATQVAALAIVRAICFDRDVVLVRTDDPSPYETDRILFETGGRHAPDDLCFDHRVADEDVGPLRLFWRTVGPEFVEDSLDVDRDDLHQAVADRAEETIVADIDAAVRDPASVSAGHIALHVADVICRDPATERYVVDVSEAAETLGYVLKTRMLTIYRQLAASTPVPPAP